MEAREYNYAISSSLCLFGWMICRDYYQAIAKKKKGTQENSMN
jgi:hypothetical protein